MVRIINIFFIYFQLFCWLWERRKGLQSLRSLPSALTSRKTVPSCVSEGLPLLHYDPCCFRLQHRPKLHFGKDVNTNMSIIKFILGAPLNVLNFNCVSFPFVISVVRFFYNRSCHVFVV